MEWEFDWNRVGCFTKKERIGVGVSGEREKDFM